MSSPILPMPYRDTIAERSRGEKDRRYNLVTQPWYKWFRSINDFIDDLFTNPSSVLGTTDAWLNDFSQEDFWSNVPGPGASPPASWDIVDAEVDHPGIQRLRTDINVGDITSAFFPVAASAGALRWDQISTVTLNFKTAATITTSRFECGISDNPASGWPATVFESGANAIYPFYDTAVDNNLHLRMRVGGALVHDYTVITPCPADTWLRFFFRRRLQGSAAILDLMYRQGSATADTLIATVTTGLPADSTTYGGMFRVGTRVAAARDFYIDRFLMPPPTNLNR